LSHRQQVLFSESSSSLAALWASKS